MPPTVPPSVAVIGAGAIGCYYGARLAEAGYDVRFLMRSDYEAVSQHGLRVTSHLGDIHLPSPTIGRTAEELAEYGTVDWLIVALKSYALGHLPRLATPLLAPRTRILSILNGIDIEDDIAAALPGYQIFGGLGFIGVSRPQPGHVFHQEFGALDIGHHGDDPQAIQEAIALWEPTVVAARPAVGLVRVRWLKMLWNVPFNGLSVAADGATCEFISTTPAFGAVARRMMEEVAQIANADLADRGLEQIADIQAACDRTMRLTGITENFIPSTGADLVRGRPLEVEPIFIRPVQRAIELGVDAPLTAFIAALVQRRDPRRQLP